jgi:hypothetical protein
VGKTIQVTSAQVNAARLWIERAESDGTPVPEAIRKLAQARPRPVVRKASMADGLVEMANGAGPTDDPLPTAAGDDREDVDEHTQGNGM